MLIGLVMHQVFPGPNRAEQVIMVMRRASAKVLFRHWQKCTLVPTPDPLTVLLFGASGATRMSEIGLWRPESLFCGIKGSFRAPPCHH